MSNWACTLVVIQLASSPSRQDFYYKDGRESLLLALVNDVALSENGRNLLAAGRSSEASYRLRAGEDPRGRECTTSHQEFTQETTLNLASTSDLFADRRQESKLSS